MNVSGRAVRIERPMECTEERAQKRPQERARALRHQPPQIRHNASSGLFFRVRAEYHWASRALAALFTFASLALVLSAPLGNWPALVAAAAAAAAMLGFMRDHVTILRVTHTSLFATGDLGGYGNGHLQLRVAKLRELHYAPAGAGQSEGLYAREGEWCSRCVLPRLNESQANAIVAEIALHHPQLLPSGMGIVPALLSTQDVEDAATTSAQNWKTFWAHHRPAALGVSRGH